MYRAKQHVGSEQNSLPSLATLAFSVFLFSLHKKEKKIKQNYKSFDHLFYANKGMMVGPRYQAKFNLDSASPLPLLLSHFVQICFHFV